ncbi:PilZ domain-containing protein [Photobacterium rosenbergii]|uniref:PilZ domain-containing protein n=1 Tax=Photobacterium rosenbergii TaxID=294936 RepID=A0A2T3MYL5_9GAMM|nr:PilZ domain-containing protein [Photobacterium rosenbergii]PSW05059.1 PilZ domain-containing protein [Photobacterium rosenbergii]
MVLDDYKGLIERLIPVYDSEDFDDVFQMMTEGEDGPTRLQLKMELHRIMTPCMKAVDLRGRVQGECRPYQLNGREHWLDDVAINTYHKRIKTFGNQFRVGLYEALMNTRNNFRVMHQQGKMQPKPAPKVEQQPDNPLVAPLIRFGHYLTRNENRWQIATPVSLELPLSQVVNGISADLSYSGAKFKVPAAFNYKLGMTIVVRFPKLAEQLGDARLVKGMSYRILGIDENPDNDSYKWLRLKLLSDNALIKSVIDYGLSQSQNRTRHNYEDKIIQIRTRGYEHCFLKHSTSLPVFLSGTELTYCLLTQYNRHIWSHWHDERNQPVLNQLISADRLASLGKAGLKQSSTLLYSFSHEHDGKTFFYSAALPEMNAEQRRLFWHIGAQRDSWRVMRLSLQPIDQEDIESLKSIAPDMVDKLSSLTHVGVLQDLTNKEAQQDYRLSIKPQLPSKTLQAFRHPRNPVASAKAVYFDPRPQRKEDRYLFDTSIVLNTDNSSPVTGQSIDFSTRGLNIKLSAPVALSRGDQVLVSFPGLQKSNKNAPLNQVPYSVVRVSPDYRNIQLTTGSGTLAAQSEHFLRKLILHNENKLVMAEEKLPQGELLLAMHQMLLTRLKTVPYFAEKVDHKIRLKAVGCNFPPPPQIKLFSQLADGQECSLEPLFRNRIKQMLAETMRPVEINQPYIHELYLAIEQKSGQTPRVEAKLLGEFRTIEERIAYIKQAKSTGSFMALRLTAAPVLSPMTALIGKELGDLARLVLHRARALEQELNSVIGSGEIQDVTDEVLIRLEIK